MSIGGKPETEQKRRSIIDKIDSPLVLCSLALVRPVDPLLLERVEILSREVGVQAYIIWASRLAAPRRNRSAARVKECVFGPTVPPPPKGASGTSAALARSVTESGGISQPGQARPAYVTALPR